MARFLVIGGSGTGKSFYTGYLLEQAVPKFDYAIHYDLENEEVGLSDANHDPLYKTLTVDVDRYRNMDFLKVLGRNKRLRIVPDLHTMEQASDLYGMLCALAMQIGENTRYSVLVTCDEAHNVTNHNKLDPRVERMITGGRKHGVECGHISQRPQLLSVTIRSQSDKRVYFRVDDGNDLDKIDEVSNINAHKHLPGLQDRRCIVENRSSGEWTELDTNTIKRQRPHYSGDDGLMDEVLPV